MTLSPTAQATLLLTSYFSRANSTYTKPLTNVEWGRFALWLKEQSTTPADLLVFEPKSLLDGWRDSRVSVDRIVQLLGRGHSLALAVEKWQRAGLWVVTRSDPEYPRRLKQRLKNDSPPVLFGCGNNALLNSGGLAVIGSRNASDADLSFTTEVGVKAAVEGVAVVSGGARGVDEAAMQGALRQGGVVIGVMADSLMKAATSARWREGLMGGHVVLVSPFYPEAGFSAGNAMARNKYIYCLADSSLVIHSGKKGGTLNGAAENLKKRWVPLWVKPTDDKDAANTDLVASGGRWCEAETRSLRISDLFATEATATAHEEEEQVDLFSISAQPELLSEPGLYSDEKIADAQGLISRPGEHAENPVACGLSAEIDDRTTVPVDFYQLFVIELRRLAASPVTLDVLIESTGLHKSQLNDWLKRATKEGVVNKLSHPVCYQVKEGP